MAIIDPDLQPQGKIPNIEITGTEPQPKEQSTFDKYLGIGSPVQRVVAGAVNEPLMAVGQMVIDPFANLLGYGQPVKEYAKKIAGLEEQRRAAEGDTGIDAYKMAGAIASPLNYIAGTKLAQAAGTGMRGALATGAVTGALAAPTLEEDMAAGKAKQAGMGAVAGGAAQLVGNAASRILSPRVSAEEQLLRDLGVQPTTGETTGGILGEIEKTLAGVPGLRRLVNPAQQRSIEAFNYGILNKPLKDAGLEPIESGVIGQKAMKTADERMSAAYDEVLGNMNFTLDPATAQAMVAAKAAKTLTGGQQRVLDRKVAEILGTRVKPGQTIDGATMKEIESAFKKEVERFDKSTMPGQNDIGDALDNVFGAFKDSIKKQNPDYAQQLTTLDKSFAQLETLRLAVNKADKTGGVFSPEQLLKSIGEAAKTRTGKKYTSYGEAFLQPEAQAAQKIIGQANEGGDWGKVGLLGAGYAAWNNPIAAAGTAVGTGILYTKLGQKVADTLLRARPEEAKLIGNAIEKAGTVTPAIAAQIQRVMKQEPVSSEPSMDLSGSKEIPKYLPRKTLQPISMAPDEAKTIIAQTAQEKGAGKYTGLLTGMAKVESNFDVNAKNKNSSATGLFQMTKAAQKDYGVANPLDPKQNAAGATDYFMAMMKRYNGDVIKALAAYNQGPGVIDKGLNKAGREYAMKVINASRGG